MTSFTPDNGRVVMVTEYGPAYLTLAQADELLALFEGIDGRAIQKLHNGLYDAFLAAGGIPRGRSSRRAA